jgi:hypothetical protein
MSFASDRELDPVMDRDTEEHREQLLDQALEATFPASDPVAMTLPSEKR